MGPSHEARHATHVLRPRSMLPFVCLPRYQYRLALLFNQKTVNCMQMPNAMQVSSLEYAFMSSRCAMLTIGRHK